MLHSNAQRENTDISRMYFIEKNNKTRRVFIGQLNIYICTKVTVNECENKLSTAFNLIKIHAKNVKKSLKIYLNVDKYVHC